MKFGFGTWFMILATLMGVNVLLIEVRDIGEQLDKIERKLNETCKRK